MTYEEMLAKIALIRKRLNTIDDIPCDYQNKATTAFCKVVETGGVSGGSCWDNSNPRRYDNNPKESDYRLNDLEAFLRAEFPNLTYFQYQDIMELIEHSEEIDREYYGNRTEYDIRSIPFDKFYEYLKANLIKDYSSDL